MDIDLWRRAAIKLVNYACGREDGRSKNDPVYRQVTEGRDEGVNRKYYSSCADLAHWLFWRLGVREPWLNREANGFRRGLNVSLLSTSPVAFVPTIDDEVIPGDVMINWNHEKGFDAHVCVALRFEGEHLWTGNYGAGGLQSGAWPGARLAKNRLSRDAGWLRYGMKRVQRVLALHEVLGLRREPPDFSGAALTGEELDALDAEALP